MARRYIPITNVSDIDTSKISLRTINNRYIDKSGQRYATRFNLRTHKIEIVKIALGKEEAQEVKNQQKSKTDTGAKQQGNREHPMPMKIPDWVKDSGVEPDTSSDFNSHLTNAEKEMNRMGERFRGLISSIKLSGVLEEMHDVNHHDMILELTNFYDRDIQAHINKIQSLAVEFIRFPKPLANYISIMDRNCKRYVEKLDSEKQKAYVRAYMLAPEYFALMKAGNELIDKVETVTKEIRAEKLPHERKAAFENSRETMAFLRKVVNEETAKMLGWLIKADVI
jgi:hypothetical protein